MTDSVSEPPELDELRARYPGWSIWSSNRQVWYAVRAGDLSDGAMASGCDKTVHGEDLATLAAKLDHQVEMDDKAKAIHGGLR